MSGPFLVRTESDVRRQLHRIAIDSQNLRELLVEVLSLAADVAAQMGPESGNGRHSEGGSVHVDALQAFPGAPMGIERHGQGRNILDEPHLLAGRVLTTKAADLPLVVRARLRQTAFLPSELFGLVADLQATFRLLDQRSSLGSEAVADSCLPVLSLLSMPEALLVAERLAGALKEDLAEGVGVAQSLSLVGTYMSSLSAFQSALWCFSEILTWLKDAETSTREKETLLRSAGNNACAAIGGMLQVKPMEHDSRTVWSLAELSAICERGNPAFGIDGFFATLGVGEDAVSAGWALVLDTFANVPVSIGTSGVALALVEALAAGSSLALSGGERAPARLFNASVSLISADLIPGEERSDRSWLRATLCLTGLALAFRSIESPPESLAFDSPHLLPRAFFERYDGPSCAVNAAGALSEAATISKDHHLVRDLLSSLGFFVLLEGAAGERIRGSLEQANIQPIATGFSLLHFGNLFFQHVAGYKGSWKADDREDIEKLAGRFWRLTDREAAELLSWATSGFMRYRLPQDLVDRFSSVVKVVTGSDEGRQLRIDSLLAELSADEWMRGLLVHTDLAETPTPLSSILDPLANALWALAATEGFEREQVGP